MMVNKRLIGTVSESKKYIAGNVILQWCSLAANIAMMFSITGLFAGLYYGNTTSLDMQRIHFRSLSSSFASYRKDRGAILSYEA